MTVKHYQTSYPNAQCVTKTNMTNKQKLESLYNAYTLVDEETNNERYILNEQHPLYETVKNVQFELNDDTHTFELDYDIMHTACVVLSENSENYEDVDWYEATQDTASVYTAAQLRYINIWNQSEITDIARESELDIATAAGVWYEQKVAEACHMLLEAITK